MKALNIILSIIIIIAAVFMAVTGLIGIEIPKPVNIGASIMLVAAGLLRIFLRRKSE